MMTRSKPKTFDDLPLFADESSLAEVSWERGKPANGSSMRLYSNRAACRRSTL